MRAPHIARGKNCLAAIDPNMSRGGLVGHIVASSAGLLHLPVHLKMPSDANGACQVAGRAVGLLAILAAACSSTMLSTEAGGLPENTAQWWRDGVCYEVFVRSFADADGDGIGDLRGLTARLDYIN